MTGRLSMVSRGKFIDFVDNALSSPTKHLLDAHEAVTIGQLVQLGQSEHTIPPGLDTEKHTNVQFLGDDPMKAFFPKTKGHPDSPTKSAILISAYIQALRVSLYKNPDDKPSLRVPRSPVLPIKTYWITGAQHFEIYVALANTNAEVQVLLLTPDPENVPPKPAIGTPENIWAIGTDNRITTLYSEISGYGASPPFLVNQAKCLKLWGY